MVVSHAQAMRQARFGANPADSTVSPLLLALRRAGLRVRAGLRTERRKLPPPRRKPPGGGFRGHRNVHFHTPCGRAAGQMEERLAERRRAAAREKPHDGEAGRRKAMREGQTAGPEGSGPAAVNRGRAR